MISVAVPVGPNPAYRKYLKECLDSVRAQKVPVSEILVIDDQAHLTNEDVGEDVRLWESPWLLGVAHAFNFGVALAKNPLVIMLGSDDRLESWATEDLEKAYRKHKDDEGYYWYEVQYSDGRSQRLACNCAAATKGLWMLTGGFPVQAAVGACDSILISMMISNPGLAKHLHQVDSSKPPYWYRVHEETVTAKSGPWQNVIYQTRDILTKSWEKPSWTRL